LSKALARQATYLDVDNRIKGDVSEKAYAAVLLSSSEAIDRRMVDEKLSAAARDSIVGRGQWIDVQRLADDGAR
jgi:hypothetical protein